MKKVNVWQVGYSNMKDYMLRNNNSQCKERGYVLLESDGEDWEEEVWNLLNWSCWTQDKPSNVHSLLDHCNADIILQIENTNTFRVALFSGFKSYSTLQDAYKALQYTPWELWPFPEVHRESGRYKSDGEKVWIMRSGTDCWEEI